MCSMWFAAELERSLFHKAAAVLIGLPLFFKSRLKQEITVCFTLTYNMKAMKLDMGCCSFKTQADWRQQQQIV